MSRIDEPHTETEGYCNDQGELAGQYMCEGISLHQQSDASQGCGEQGVPGETRVNQLEPCFCSRVPEACHLYCESCRRAVCEDCASSMHVNHSCKRLSEVAEVIRNEAKDAIRGTQQSSHAIADAVKSRTALIQSVEASTLDACSTIEKAFDELNKVMEQRKRELLAQVEQMSDAKRAALSSRRNELETLHREIGEYCEVAAHTFDTLQEEEVTPLWDLLTAEMQAVQGRFEAMPEVSPGLTTAIVDPTSIAETISKFGVIDQD